MNMDHHAHGGSSSPRREHSHVAHEGHMAPKAANHAIHGHDKHVGHSPDMFRHRFWLSALLTLPILYVDRHFQAWFGYQAVAFPGAAWVQPLLSVALYLYGGGVFVQGAIRELKIRQPGMMTLIGLAISVAFVYSLAVSLALLEPTFESLLCVTLNFDAVAHRSRGHSPGDG
jgi:P-type Cu2+ transporter